MLFDQVLDNEVVAVPGSDVQRGVAHDLGALVGVLPLSDHDPHGVETALLAGSPDV